MGSMRPTDAAAFLQAIPTRFAARAANHMRPAQVALLLQEMEQVAAAALLRQLNFLRAATVLRQIAHADRTQLLEQLPRQLKRDFEMSLAFPPGSVGASMTTSLVTVTAKDKASKALSLLKRAGPEGGDIAFVVDEENKLLGAVSIATLLRQPSGQTVAESYDQSCPVLNAQSRLAKVAGLDAWHDYSRLPVVTHRGEVIGALAHTATRTTSRQAAPLDSFDLFALIGMFYDTAVELMKLLEPVSRDSDEAEENH